MDEASGHFLQLLCKEKVVFLDYLAVFDFRRDVDEICGLLGYYMACILGYSTITLLFISV
jgi:hypothetical protein